MGESPLAIYPFKVREEQEGTIIKLVTNTIQKKLKNLVATEYS